MTLLSHTDHQESSTMSPLSLKRSTVSDLAGIASSSASSNVLLYDHWCQTQISHRYNLYNQYNLGKSRVKIPLVVTSRIPNSVTY